MVLYSNLNSSRSSASALCLAAGAGRWKSNESAKPEMVGCLSAHAAKTFRTDRLRRFTPFHRASLKIANPGPEAFGPGL